jgi:tyrosyl-tRNA synthetase
MAGDRGPAPFPRRFRGLELAVMGLDGRGAACYGIALTVEFYRRRREMIIMASDVFTLLESRGYIYQCTNLDAVTRLLKSDEKITFYLGIDPTADSLHIGHFFALMMFRYLQDAGHKGILVIGGATALIGDPSGKSDMRKMLTKEQVQYNLEEVRILVKRFVRTDDENPAIILNNADWINQYSYVDFMRLVGIHFNINTMLTADAYANRLKQGGLTFLEMGYMLMQAFDFVHLNNNYGCMLQIGGSDQWGNIIAGTSLKRKIQFREETIDKGNEIFGLTCPLLLTKEGKKMGKTETGTLWVAREKTTSYDFYQYFYNVDDDDVEMLLKLFTHVSLDEIAKLCSLDIIKAKQVMAYEITRLVHGDEEANKVLETVKSLFSKENNSDQNAMPSFKLDRTVIHDEISIVDLLTVTNFMPSKSEARRMIKQGGIVVDGKKVNDVELVIPLTQDSKDCILVKKGKKTFLKVIL